MDVPQSKKSPASAVTTPSAVDLLTWSQFKAIALPAFDAALCPRGFERFGTGMTWVDSRLAPIRRLLVLAAWKGAAVAPQWGFSFN